MESLEARAKQAGYQVFLFPYEWILSQPHEPPYQAYLEVCRDLGIAEMPVLMSPSGETRQAGLCAGLELEELPPCRRPEAVPCWNDEIAEEGSLRTASPWTAWSERRCHCRMPPISVSIPTRLFIGGTT